MLLSYGFGHLRNDLPMNCRALQFRVRVGDALTKDIRRIETVWRETLELSGSDGWLLGDFSIADAMFAPVALRFNAYALDLSPATLAYRDFWLADEHLQEWVDLAAAEPWVIEHEEVGEEPA